MARAVAGGLVGGLGLVSRTRRRKILHIATRYLRAGSERNLTHLMEWEQAAGFEVEFATSPDSNLEDLSRGFRIHEVQELQRTVHPLNDLAALRALRRILLKGRYDIVHTHQSKAGILGRVAARGLVPAAVHTVHMASYGPGYHLIASTGYRLAETAASRLTNVIVFVGEELRRTYVDAGICRGRATMVIRSPIDVDRFARTRSWSHARRTEARKAHLLPETGHLILWMGALSDRKRPVLAVHRLAAILKQNNAVLAIAGDGPLRSAIESAASVEGIRARVQLLGHVDDPAPLVAASDVVVHTSTVEGVPQVVLQAAAAGRSVVATDVIGLREIPDMPITIVDRSGANLLEGVLETFATKSPEIPVDAFGPWTTAHVDRDIQRLHDRIS